MTSQRPFSWTEGLSADMLPEDASITINAQTMEEQLGKIREVVELQHLYNAAIREIVTKLETLDSEFRVRYAHNPIHHIENRLKSPQSIMEKLRRQGLEPSLLAAREHLQDIAGVRVICHYLEDIYKIAEMLGGQADVTLIRRRDYIAQPKENGYRSLHLIVKVPVFLSDRVEHVPVEIQVRTIAMDFWATLEHELRYKSKNEMTCDQRDRLKQCAQTSAALDLEMQALRTECIEQSAKGS